MGQSIALEKIDIFYQDIKHQPLYFFLLGFILFFISVPNSHSKNINQLIEHWYEVQLIVFENNKIPDASERWNTTLTIPDTIGKKTIHLPKLKDIQAIYDQFFQKSRANLLLKAHKPQKNNQSTPWILSNDRYRSPHVVLEPNLKEKRMIELPLNDLFYKQIQKLPKHYCILYQARWRMPLSELLNPLVFFINAEYDALDTPYFLGTISFYKTKAIRVKTHFFYRNKRSAFNSNELENKPYTLINQHETIQTNGQLYYIDHPYIGVVIQIKKHLQEASLDPTLHKSDTLDKPFENNESIPKKLEQTRF